MAADKVYIDRDYNSLECFLNDEKNITIKITDKSRKSSNQVILPLEHAEDLIILLSDELNKRSK